MTDLVPTTDRGGATVLKVGVNFARGATEKMSDPTFAYLGDMKQNIVQLKRIDVRTVQERRKQIERGGLFPTRSTGKIFWDPLFLLGPHFNSMKLKWGHKRKVEAPKTAHLQISNKAWYLWQCFLLLPF